MKNVKKALSLLLAIMMLVGTFVPVFAESSNSDNVLEFADQMEALENGGVKAGTVSLEDVSSKKPEKTKLSIHKLVADKYNEGVPVDHNGGRLTEEQLNKLGTNVKGLDGVTFTYYKVEDEETFKEMLDKPANFSTKEAVKAKLPRVEGKDIITENGGVAEVELEDGDYWVIESDRPSRVTEALAVPFGITLPLTNQIKVGNFEPGSVYMKNVHVYPKNTEKKPQMDKGFGQTAEGMESSMLKDWQDTYGPDYNKYLEKKAQIDARVGSKVPYEVKTSLKQGQIYKTLSWSDIMTEGLKYNKDLKISYKSSLEGSQEKTITIADSSSKKESDYGFDVTIKDEETIKSINEALKTGDVEFTLKYTATVTRDAVVDLPESNNISFTPGEPKHKNDKDPINPSEKSITVTKTWAKGDAPSNVLVTYILFEVSEGNQKPVASVTLKGTQIQSKSLAEGMEVTNDGYNVTFKGLDNEKKYKVEEFADGYDPVYQSAVGIQNKANPDTIHPTPPQVVVGGKRFVKTDSKDTRLAGAEFVVKNEDGSKYLVAKNDEKVAKEQEAVKQAKEDLDKAIDAYNNRANDNDIKHLKDTIDENQQKYNDALKAAGNVYEWGTKENAIVLVSNAKGQFEITGLAYGTYYLEEIKAPKGFAKLEKDVEFKVDKNSYNKHEGGINYEIPAIMDFPQLDAQKVENKKLTIPQTGGIGTIIFGVVGISLMAGAVVAMKKRNEEAHE